MSAPAYTEPFRSALKRVGVTPEQVVDVLGSCLDGEDTYLVGSLAAGLGNAGSDIDLHVFVAEPAPGVVPMLFFADRTRLDLVHYQVGTPAKAVTGVAEQGAAPLAGGSCAFGTPSGMTNLKRLSRWATAVPVHIGSPPLYSPPELDRISAALVRNALEVAVRAAAVATVLEAMRSSLAQLAWSRAAEAVVETAVRAAGQIFIGDKWLPVKVSRSDVPATLLGRARQVAGAAAFDRFVTGLGIPVSDPASLVTVCRAEAPEFTFVDQAYRLIGGRLVVSPELPSQPLAGALAALPAGGAAVLGDGINTGAVTLTVDKDSVDGRLR
jgi:hypothetical protein